jgi:histone H3/H4
MQRGFSSMVPKSVVKKMMQKEAKKQNMKISREAVEKMCEVLEEIGADISRQAKVLAKHAGRETVDDSDVKLVIR